MSYYSNNKCSCSPNYTIINGNSVDIDVDSCNPEIRADIVVSEHSSIRLWGRVINCYGDPIENALVKLLKVDCNGDEHYYTGIAHTITDCDGFYQFDLCYDDDISRYKVLVGKATYGPEKIIPIECNNCDPCYEENTCCNSNHCCDCAHYDKCYQHQNADSCYNKKYNNKSLSYYNNTKY